MQQEMTTFIHKHRLESRRLLLGYSGGSDSEALLYLLSKMPCEIHLIHIDHRQRDESRFEAEKLQKRARALNLPFHLRVIEDIVPKSPNLEDRLRERRYAHFAAVYREIGADALFLGHHRDDLSETTLKRLLEGSRLSHLGGMAPKSTRRGMTIMRPLLNRTKGELRAFLQREGLSWIEDKSNADQTYLRARMRHSLFDQIETSFGKKIRQPLVQISREAAELKSYLNEKLKPLHAATITGPFGRALKIPKSTHPYELKALLKKWGLKSRQQEEAASKLILSGAACKQVGPLLIDRGWIFELNGPIPQISYRGLLKPTQFQCDQWVIEVKDEGAGEEGWIGAFRGELKLTLPDKPITFGPPLREGFSQHKVPTFLTPLLPTLYLDQKPHYRWLTPLQFGTKTKTVFVNFAKISQTE